MCTKWMPKQTDTEVAGVKDPEKIQLSEHETLRTPGVETF